MRAEKGTRCWGMQSKSQAAVLVGEDTVFPIQGLTGLFHTNTLGRKDVSYFERITLAIDKGDGRRWSGDSSGIGA